MFYQLIQSLLYAVECSHSATDDLFVRNMVLSAGFFLRIQCRITRELLSYLLEQLHADLIWVLALQKQVCIGINGLEAKQFISNRGPKFSAKGGILDRPRRL